MPDYVIDLGTGREAKLRVPEDLHQEEVARLLVHVSALVEVNPPITERIRPDPERST
jgi:hypothetical protein